MVDFGTESAAFLNFPRSDEPNPPEPADDSAAIGPDADDEWRRIRLVVPFVPDPCYFAEGIDMDEVLAAPGAEAAWGLRFFHQVSFKQLGEAETRLLTQVFERRFGNDGRPQEELVVEPATHQPALDVSLHKPFSVSEMIRARPEAYLTGARVRYEELLHGLLIEELGRPPGTDRLLSDAARLDVFHELAASPPKPPQWADAIDVMGTSSFPGGGSSGSLPTSIHYQLLEAKRDDLAGDESVYDRRISQLMKYVDFIAHNYAGGNYAAVDAAYVAADFSPSILSRHREALDYDAGVSSRSYVLNPREDSPTRRWSAIKLLRYRWDGGAGELRLESADPQM
ncbi:MAG: hypothetical protein M3406_08500 [Chloroflexota bacterium]|nr:hypothetical protein [Chloroflexota bacterium]